MVFQNAQNKADSFQQRPTNSSSIKKKGNFVIAYDL